MALMEKFIRNECCEDPVSIGKLEKMMEKCEVDQGGNKTMYYVEVLRLLGDVLDKNGGELFRTPLDTNQDSKQPYIFCTEDMSTRGVFFEIVVERKVLISGIEDLFTAISAFIHCAFTFNLKFPKGRRN